MNKAGTWTASTCGASWILAVALSGCAAPAGGRRTGQYSYSVTTQAAYGRGGMAAAKASAREQAAATCASQGRLVDGQEEMEQPPGISDTQAQFGLLFNCVVK